MTIVQLKKRIKSLKRMLKFYKDYIFWLLRSQIAAAHPAAEQRGMFRAAALLFDLIQKSKSFI